jgi:hypothetical protein
MPVDTTTQTPPVTTTDKVKIQGPDQKWYAFKKGTPPEKIDKYFTKQGWVKKEGKWFTATGDPATSMGLASGVGTKDRPGPGVGLSKKGVEDFATALPTIGGTAGSFVGGGRGPVAAAGAGLGGAIGEDLRQMIMRPILLGRGQQDLTISQSLVSMGAEASKQAALQYGGEKAGEYFFKLLNKIPHSVIKKGIPLLPSDLKPGSKVMAYVEDLLTNLVPSAKTMAEFKAKQSKLIEDKLTKLANGFAKFDGNPEQMGILLQNVLRKGEYEAAETLDKLRLTLPKGHQTQAELAKKFPNEVQDFMQTYKNQLSKAIIGTNKPELIAGWLKTSTAGLSDTRIVADVVHELDPKVLGKVQNRILRDGIEKTFTGHIDPVAKGSKELEDLYSGKTFKGIINTIGETKMKAIYGEEGFKRIEDFIKLTGNINNRSQAGAGKFLNLIFLIPFRQGLGVKGTAKVAMTGIFANRMARIITSPEGMRMYEGYIRASANGALKIANGYIDEARTWASQADQEYAQEEKEAEEEYNKEHKKQ